MKKKNNTKQSRSNKKPPVSTAHESRLNFYQPTRRPKTIDKIYHTSWGKLRIKGKLGQAHADVMESIFFCAEERRNYNNGKITFIVDPARLRKIARQEQGAGLDELIFELTDATFEIYEPKHLACIGHLIDFVDKSGKAGTRPNPIGTKKPFRNLWEVQIGDVVKRLLKADILLLYDPQPITSLRHGISQAVARLILGHKNHPENGYHIDTLIKQVCGEEISEINLKDRRKELRQDLNFFASIGIVIKKDRIFFDPEKS